MITFLELRIQKKSEKRPQKWARNSDPFLVPLSIGIFPAFWGLHFGAGEPLSSSFLESHNLDAERPFLQQHAAGELQSVSQLMLALNTYSFQTIKLKLAAFLPSAAPTGEAPCGAHVFEGFFGLENGPVKSDKSQEKTLFGKDFPKPAKTQS